MKNFYPSWQEASSAATSLGISSSTNYIKVARGLDVRLPSNPNLYYKDFPGWHEFLLKNKIKFYPTWQEASAMAASLGILSSYDYHKKAKILDNRLPSNPNVYYKDFPGWDVFSSKIDGERASKGNKYLTWQEASKAAIALGMDSSTSYDYRLDNRLPSCPNQYYSDFPGWKIFLGIVLIEKYSTWQEASVSAINMYIYGPKNYKIKYDRDPRLPKHPDYFYKDFPGWKEFLGKNLTEKARNYVK